MVLVNEISLLYDRSWDNIRSAYRGWQCLYNLC
jgi:hypothetical protein